jgi:MFS family permease
MAAPVRLGLKENLPQFLLLVLVNAFVGGMLGLERSILPRIAEEEFGLVARTAIFSFIIVFGLVKAATNYYTGILSARYGRKKILVLGWLLSLPVPFILMYAPSWGWIVAGNILLGVHQGLAWSSTVMMKIDLVGEKKRGLAMGLNEFAGYLALAGIAFLTGWIASAYGLRPYPFLIGIAISIIGLLLTIFAVRDTMHHVAAESQGSTVERLGHIFRDTSWRKPQLGAVTQAGLVNNLNDGMVWGLLPLILHQRGFNLVETGTITALYPAVWGMGQWATGWMADRFPKKIMLFAGMLVQALALGGMAIAYTYTHFMLLSVSLGIGTAMVYPTFLATIAENTHPLDRAQAIGVFRLWRDLGYAIGALLTGLLADWFSNTTALESVAFLTLLSAVAILVRMRPVRR